jgi:hypothetical protein
MFLSFEKSGFLAFTFYISTPSLKKLYLNLYLLYCPQPSAVDLLLNVCIQRTIMVPPPPNNKIVGFGVGTAWLLIGVNGHI